MDDETAVIADTHQADTGEHAESADTADTSGDELVDELLIEEISIDGMCGVY